MTVWGLLLSCQVFSKFGYALLYTEEKIWTNLSDSFLIMLASPCSAVLSACVAQGGKPHNF